MAARADIKKNHCLQNLQIKRNQFLHSRNVSTEVFLVQHGVTISEFNHLNVRRFSLPGAEIRSVCTEAGMFAIRARRKIATEKDFLEAVNKVIKSYAKFSATPRYMTYNWAFPSAGTELRKSFIVVCFHLIKKKTISRSVCVGYWRLDSNCWHTLLATFIVSSQTLLRQHHTSKYPKKVLTLWVEPSSKFHTSGFSAPSKHLEVEMAAVTQH